jgi:hypothetical protein
MSNPKELRKQLRNVVQEQLPDLLKSELGNALHKDLSHIIQTRLNVVIKNIQETLEQIDQRSKDIQGYIVRQSLNPISTPATTLETSGANLNEQKQQANQGSEGSSS